MCIRDRSGVHWSITCAIMIASEVRKKEPASETLPVKCINEKAPSGWRAFFDWDIITIKICYRGDYMHNSDINTYYILNV